MLCTIGLVFVTFINTLYACNIVQFSQVENNCIQDFYYACAAATGLPSYLYSYYIGCLHAYVCACLHAYVCACARVCPCMCTRIFN